MNVLMLFLCLILRFEKMFGKTKRLKRFINYKVIQPNVTL